MNDETITTLTGLEAAGTLMTSNSGFGNLCSEIAFDPLGSIKTAFKDQYNCDFNEFITAVLNDHPELKV